jgi:glycosyltransferase involved in cell wall biosynthesis
MVKKRKMIRKYGDVFLVTTPDLKEFIPEAQHLPFFLPEVTFPSNQNVQKKNGEPIRILHVTGHPGLEGTSEIESTVNRLKTKGYPIEFTFLNFVSHDTVLEELGRADITVGKMKMGYYANFQIESMLLGVPAITYVRPEFMTNALKESGFILCDLGTLEETLKYYLDNSAKLEEKRSLARRSILALHDNDKIAQRLISIYKSVRKRDK